MTASMPSRTSIPLARLLALSLAVLGPQSGQAARAPLRVYLEDDHAATFQFLASALDLDTPHAMVLVDAHSDSSTPRDVEGLRAGLRRVVTAEERQERLTTWRREGAVQSFDWIVPLMPAPIERVLWVDDRPTTPTSPLPRGFVRVRLEQVAARLPPELPVVASVDLDAFAGLTSDEQQARFERVWKAIVALPGSPPSPSQSHALGLPTTRGSLTPRVPGDGYFASPGPCHRGIEPWGIEGPDRQNGRSTSTRGTRSHRDSTSRVRRHICVPCS